MNTPRTTRFATLSALLVGAVVTFAGCQTEGPAENAGEKIDKGLRDVKDTVNPPGPVEKAGRAVDDALDKK